MIPVKTASVFNPITEREKWLTEQVVNIAIAIHRKLGPGLLKWVYEKCFCHELEKRNIPFVRQQSLLLKYEELVIEDGLRLDIIIDDAIIIELKAEQHYLPAWEPQLLSYLRLSGKRLGYILNFHAPLMKNGIRRMINN